MNEKRISINSLNDSNGNLIIHIPNFIQESGNFFSASQKDDITHLFKISFFSYDGQRRLYVDNPNVLRDVLKKYCMYKKLSGKVETPTGIKINNATTKRENEKEIDNKKFVISSEISAKQSDDFIEQETIEEDTNKKDNELNLNKPKRVTIVENYPTMKTFEAKYVLRNNLFAIEEAECEESSPILSSEELHPEIPIQQSPIDQETETPSFETNLVTIIDKHELNPKLSTEEELESLVSFLRMSVDEFYPDPEPSPVRLVSSVVEVSNTEDTKKSTVGEFQPKKKSSPVKVSTFIQATTQEEPNRNDAATVTTKRKCMNCILS